MGTLFLFLPVGAAVFCSEYQIDFCTTSFRFSGARLQAADVLLLYRSIRGSRFKLIDPERHADDCYFYLEPQRHADDGYLLQDFFESLSG